MLKTKGISPKVIGPLVTALTAFSIDKIEDTSTEALVVALIGTAAAIPLPPGDVEMVPTTGSVVKRTRSRLAKDQVN